MTISNFQLIAINQTLAGASLTPPNITVNMAAYSNVAAVSSYSNAYIFGNVAYTNGNITLSNWANLQALGSNSFPQFFGTTPFVYSSNLNTGPLFLKISTRISNLFPTSKDLSVPIQTINSAYLYARQKSELISAAATASFGSENSPLYFSTGGLVAFGGANATPASMQTVGSVIAQLGDLIDFQRINASFSLAGIVSQIIQSGQMQIGNLHINFFNKVITDPITGQPLFVTPALINQMLNQPTQLLSNQNTYPMVANHRYEAPLRALIDEALVNPGDLNAVLTLIGVAQPTPTSQQIAAGVATVTNAMQYTPRITKFSDCLNVENMLGPAASAIIKTGVGFGGGIALNAAVFITGLLINIKSSQNIQNSTTLGNAIMTLDLMSSAPNITTLSVPLSSTDFSNICGVIGSGSGPNNTILVADVLGSTALNSALINTIIGLNQLDSTANLIILQHLKADTANLATGLNSNILAAGIGLSNGNLYYTPNNLVSNAIPLIEQNAAIAALSANALYFAGYNAAAQTHNNSISLMKITGINVANLANNTSSIISFVTQLPNYSPNPNGILDFIMPLLNSNIGGQSISAVLSDTTNQNILKTLGVTKETGVSQITTVSSISPAVPIIF